MVINTIPPWVLAAEHAEEETDLPPDAGRASSPPSTLHALQRLDNSQHARAHAHWTDANIGKDAPSSSPTSSPHAHCLPSLQKSDELMMVRMASPESEHDHELGPDVNLSPATADVPPGERLASVSGPATSQPTPVPSTSQPDQAQSRPQSQQPGSFHPMRHRLHRLRQRLSEYHANDDSDAVSDDYDTNYEDISDDEIHNQSQPSRPAVRGRRSRVTARTNVRRLERSRSLEQNRFTWDKDEWLSATLRMSPEERRRMGHEIRNTLANSGSYWAKRRQRRKLRKQMRTGGGGSDPNDSFQPMNLAVEAAETFGSPAFTGHAQSAYKKHISTATALQHPDAPLPILPELASGRGSHFARFHSWRPGDARDQPDAILLDIPPDESSAWARGSSRTRLERMSGLRAGSHTDEDTNISLDQTSEKDVFTRRQASDERWNAPWKPEMNAGLSRTGTGWSLPDGGTVFGFLPWLRRRRAGNGEEDLGFGYGYGQKHKKARSRFASPAWWYNFLLHNPFAPLFVRTMNLAIATSTLAVAIKERQSLRAEGVEDIVGVSPLLGIIFAPLTLAHIFFQVWLEYFGRPIGLWSVRSKLLGTSIEIIFVGMWSAEMALAWDNYYTTPNFDLPHERRGYIRRLQCFLIGLSFISLFAYMITLIVRSLQTLLFSAQHSQRSSHRRER